MAIAEYLTALTGIKTVMEIVEKIIPTLPDSPEKEELTKELAEAQKAAGLAEAQAAQNLGYTLCHCTWPPRIMLQVRWDDDMQRYIFQCSKCQDEYPKPLKTTAKEKAGS